jgi:hypothetical protein
MREDPMHQQRWYGSFWLKGEIDNDDLWSAQPEVAFICKPVLEIVPGLEMS